MNKFSKFGRGLLAVSLVAVSSVASAAVDISSEVAGAKTDIGVAGGLVLGVIVAAAVFTWLRRVIK